MKKLVLIIIIVMSLFSVKSFCKSGGSKKILEFKHALETKDVDVLNKMLQL